MNQSVSEKLSFVRIKEVLEDSPEHKPGITRSNTKDIWFKDRELEALPDSDGNLVPQPKHPVAYVNKNVGKELNQVLKNNKVEKLAQLPQEEFSQKLTDLYSKLDYVHPFH
jgi:hypothetical protein